MTARPARVEETTDRLLSEITRPDRHRVETTTQQLLAVCGVIAFQALVEVHGGTRILIPRTLESTQGPHLVQLLGPDIAADLVAEMPGQWVPVPNMRATPNERAGVHRLLGLGMTTREIALTLRITEKTVWKHRATWVSA